MNRNIELSDGLYLEVSIDDSEAQEVSLRGKINTTFDDITKIIEEKVENLSSTLSQLKESSNVSEAKVTIGFGFSAEGNLILTKSNVDSSIKIELTFK